MLRQAIRHLPRPPSALRRLSCPVSRPEDFLNGGLRECGKRSGRIERDTYGSGYNQSVKIGRVAGHMGKHFAMETIMIKTRNPPFCYQEQEIQVA